MVYISNTGHTEEMAEVLEEEIKAKGHELNVYTEEPDADEFLDADLLIFGSPACGTEEVDDSIIQPTIESLSSLEGKKVFMFGSFGWGDGEYMEIWTDEMKDKGAEIVANPVVCLEDPDDEAKEALKEAVNSF